MKYSVKAVIMISTALLFSMHLYSQQSKKDSVKITVQNIEDTTDVLFHDFLLNNFVGKWTASGTVHEQPFNNIDFEVKWGLNHQFLIVHEKSRDTVPWLQTYYESYLFIGYDRPNKRYVAHLMNVFGGENPLCLFYGKRTLNKIEFISHFSEPSSGSLDGESFTWQPVTKSWRFVGKNITNGKEEPPYLNLEIVQNSSSH